MDWGWYLSGMSAAGQTASDGLDKLQLINKELQQWQS